MYILITHDDLDGAGCAIVFKNKFRYNIEIQYHNYNTIDAISKELLATKNKYEKIFFADISPNESEGIQMLKDPKFVIIDHHKTREYLIDSPHFNIEMCATYLSYKYLSNDEMTKFIMGIDAWDCWKLDSPFREYGEDFNFLFGYYGMTDFVEKFKYMPGISDDESIIIEVLRKTKNDYLLNKLKQARVMLDDDGNRYLEVHIGETQSSISNILEINDNIVDIKYLKCINLNDGIVSLYSLGFDVSVIAQKHGGGGHARASGYTIQI